MSRSFENIASHAVAWSALFSVFMMNVQLGQNYHQRDLVDHAVAAGADAVTKSMCDERAGANAVDGAVRPLLDLAAPPGACKMHVTRASGDVTPGTRNMVVAIDCAIPCKIPLASAVMCHDGVVSFSAKQNAVARGCDAAPATSDSTRGGT